MYQQIVIINEKQILGTYFWRKCYLNLMWSHIWPL